MFKAEEKEITNVVSSWYVGIGSSSLGAQEAKFIASIREVNIGICICPYVVSFLHILGTSYIQQKREISICANTSYY